MILSSSGAAFETLVNQWKGRERGEGENSRFLRIENCWVVTIISAVLSLSVAFKK